MMMSRWIVLLVAWICCQISSVLTFNGPLSQLEGNLLYNYLQTPAHLNAFYETLLESNGVEDVTRLHQTMNDEDIRQLHVEDKCFKSADDLLVALNISQVTGNSSFSREVIQRVLPSLAHVKLNDGCRKPEGRATWKNILIGLITVTFINCSALCGAIILPFRRRPAFKWILNAFIGLAVGTLTGSGIFHLIPMAFSIPETDVHHSYLNKALIPMVIIYLYYMRDQFLRIFFNVETIVGTHNHGGEPITEPDIHIEYAPSPLSHSHEKSDHVVVEPASQKNNRRGLIQSLRTMKAAGWMIFIGDLLHNFIDGLTLGAAFTVSIGEGLRMSLPIICEEFPHELGDIAVLLSSGLTIGQALFMNFLSASSCYLGFLLGAKLGELEEFHPWIYALAGGMFVYIGLADMVPELVSMGDEIEKDYIEANQPITTGLRLKILLCQNVGFVLGVVVMFLLGKYGEHLENLVKL